MTDTTKSEAAQEILNYMLVNASPAKIVTYEGLDVVYKQGSDNELEVEKREFDIHVQSL
jgi:hypothetical protein